MAINFDASALGLVKSNGDMLPRIIQYVETVTATHITRAYGDDISQFDTNIAPKHATSHILLFAHVFVGADTNADLGLVFRRTISGGSIGNLGDSTGSGASGANCSIVTGMNVTSTQGAHYCGWHLDHPNTTSTCTYGLRAYPNGSRTMYINRRGADASYTGRSRLVCIEIGDI